MTPQRSQEESLLKGLCATVEEDLPQGVPFSVTRSWRDGWCIFDGPTCKFFVGESRDADGRRWISFGPVARRTEISGDAEGFREEFSYRLREAGRKLASETPLSGDDAPEGEEARSLLEGLHERVVADLGSDELLYDGWIVWGWETVEPWPTIPGLAGPG